MKKFLIRSTILFLLTLPFIYISAATNIASGTISTNTTWTLAGSPYYINGNILIADNPVTGTYKNPTLTIDPGVQVVITGYYQIVVQGTLKAKGTAANKIVFRRGNTATENLPTDTAGLSNLSNSNGGWKGIVWDNSASISYTMWDNDSSIMEYCVFKYGKVYDGYWPYCNGGAIKVLWSDCYLRFTNCEFYSNYSNVAGGAIYNNGKLTIEKCTFKYNQATNGGAVYFEAYNPKIKNCTFQYNRANNHGGAIYLDKSDASITNSIIVNNNAVFEGGAINYGESNGYFANNIVANNFAGGAGIILLNNSSPSFVNNTFTNNKTNWSGCVTFWSFSASTFYNNIFWNNKDINGNIKEIMIDKPTSIPVFSNCIIDEVKPTISGITWNNIFNSDPLFVSPTTDIEHTTNALTANWKLQNTTPAINQGIENIQTKNLDSKDVYANNRRANGGIDIGATETHIGKIIAPRNINSTIYWSADTVLVTSDSIIISLTGKIIIAPGTKVVLKTNAPIICYGAIDAKGTEKLPILFTKSYADTTGFYNRAVTTGGWGGIVMDNDWFGAKGAMNVPSTFKFCEFRYAKRTAFLNDLTGGAFNLVFWSKVDFSNCTFRDNIGVNGGAIFMTKYSNPQFNNCSFYNNTASDKGGAMATNISSSPIVKYSRFINNYATWAGGAIRLQQGQAMFSNNIICNNNCWWEGGAISGYNTSSLFVNNTIAYNEAANGGGVHFNTGGGSSFYNTLFWDNNSHQGQGDQITMVLSEVNFYNCNISNKNSKNSPVMYPDVAYSWYGDTANISSLEPYFINPVNDLSADVSYFDADTYEKKACKGDVSKANYAVSNFSGIINKGILAIPGFTDFAFDFKGNPRINDNIVDIGAYENQGKKPVIISQPSGKPLCMGDTITLTISIADTAKFQWQKDGTNIANAQTKTLTIKNISSVAQGNYNCIVTNGYGSNISSAVFITINKKPQITQQPEMQWVDKSLKANYIVTANGSEPLSYQWLKNNANITNATNNILAFASVTKADEASYKCEVSNICGKATSNEVGLTIVPQICMVTVDSNNRNLIVWDRVNSSKAWKQYNIYREGKVAGSYLKIGTVPYSALSVFSDTFVNSKSQAFVYKISGVDNANIETDLKYCSPHKVIHLLVTEGVPTGFQLDWDEYFGFEYGTYKIYRSIDNKAFELVHEQASTTRTWTDFSTGNNYRKYYVSVASPITCAPNKLKANSGPFSHSVSNLEDNRLRGTTTNLLENKSSGISVSPNPSNDKAYIHFTLTNSTKVHIKVLDISGAVLKEEFSKHLHVGKQKISIGDNLNQGIYMINFNDGKQVKNIIFIKR